MSPACRCAHKMHPAFLFAALVVAAAVVPGPALGASSFCTSAYFWYPNGSRSSAGPDWSSTFFRAGPCLKVSGIGATQTYLKTVLLVDRSNAFSTYMTLPANKSRLAFAEEVDLGSDTWRQRGLDVVTNTFCSTGQHVADGDFVSIGGHMAGESGGYTSTVASRRRRAQEERRMHPGSRRRRGSASPLEATWVPFSRRKEKFSSCRRAVVATGGGYSVRLFSPCTDGTCDFAVVAQLKERRWYPSSQLLADGRVLVVGGSKTATGLNTPSLNVPSVEYFPRASGEGSYFLQFLEDALPFNLYPFVHLLPNGLVFIFAGTSYVLWDVEQNQVASDRGRSPRLRAYLGDQEVQFVNPLAGTSAMFPLSYEDDWRAEVMVCGGAPKASETSNKYVAENRCWSVAPLDSSPKWEEEQAMAFPRVMPLAVLLPDGNLVIHGGAGYGHAGFPNTARSPVLQPEMFDTRSRTWYGGDLGVSKIVRLYHASGFLLHDSSVLFTGSNPNSNDKKITRVVSDGKFPTEFRSEIYSPPYFQSGGAVPSILTAPRSVRTGSSFTVTFKVRGTGSNVRIVLAQPGFSTHGSNHGMRNVVLKVRTLTRQPNSVYTAYVAGPPDLNVCPPTWYWLFVVVNGVPNRDGRYVLLS